MKNIKSYILASVLTAFSLLTLFLSTSVIFDLFGIRAKEGNYVLFVVWANFISSLLYLVTVISFLTQKSWAATPIYVSFVVLAIAQIGLIIHIYAGGLYETKTINAMFFRMIVTGVFAILIKRNLLNRIKE